MLKTPNEFREVTIEQYYKKEKTGIYWYWRFANTKEWNKVLTPYEEVPYVIWDTKKQIEKDLKLLS